MGPGFGIVPGDLTVAENLLFFAYVRGALNFGSPNHLPC